MSYIGQGLPADTFQGYVTDTFTGDGSATTFTLSKEPFSEDSLIVVVDNVIQQPTTNFTVSGTTLTIVGTAILSGIKGYAIHTGGPLPIGGASELDLNGASDKLILDADADTTISADTDDQIDFKLGGVDEMTMSSSGIVINEGSNNRDFRIESNSNTHMLFVDGGDDRVAINNSSPTRTFSIGGDGIAALEGSSNALTFYDSSTLRAFITSQSFGSHDGDGLGIITQTGEPLKIFTNTTQRMKITSDGNIGLHHAGGSDQQVMIENQAAASGKIGLKITNPSSSAAMNGQEITCVRSGSSAYTFLICRSNSSSPDTEFNVRGDGEIFADGGTAMNTPADYAEMFEWKDGNTDSEVRFGYSVILDGDKIVKASDSDDASKIIGVVSAKPAVLGDAAWNKWSQKYLKDEWNQYILEEYTSTEWVEVKDAQNINHSYETDKIPSDVTVPSDAKVTTTESDGVTKLTRRKINPDYDSSKTYVPRQERKEWNAVGLMGKLRLRKGQPTGTNWIKMRDISDTVEEWLIR